MDLKIANVLKIQELQLKLITYNDKFMQCEKLIDNNIREAVNLWCANEYLCMLKFGHISNWDTSQINIHEFMKWKQLKNNKFDTVYDFT